MRLKSFGWLLLFWVVLGIGASTLVACSHRSDDDDDGTEKSF